MGKAPTYLEIDGADVSEYPSSGISVSGATIINKAPKDILEAMDRNINGYDIVVRFYEMDTVEWNTRAVVFFNGHELSKKRYTDLFMYLGELLGLIKKLKKSTEIKVLFLGIGDGRALEILEGFGCTCYGCETNAAFLKNAREMLNLGGKLWNLS